MELRGEVEALYARQSQAIDDGDAEAWAATFTADGVFTSPTHGAPVQGQAALRRFVDGVRERNRSAGVRERHWLNNLVVGGQDGRQWARAYLMIVRIHPDGRPELARHVVIRDELRQEDGGVRVARREVVVDPA